MHFFSKIFTVDTPSFLPSHATMVVSDHFVLTLSLPHSGHFGLTRGSCLKNAVIAPFIGVGKSCPGNRPAKSDMVEFVPMGVQACFNVPQTFASG